LNDLAFVSFEHYPIAPCDVNWPDLYREPEWTRTVLRAWREDGVPHNVPLMNTESNLSWELTEPMQDVMAALWLADSVGSFFEFGGQVYYHSPIQPEPLRPGCRGYSTYGNFIADADLNIKQYSSQYFASRMINLDWVQHGSGQQRFFPAASDVRDDAGNILVTAYAVARPDGEWSLLLVNKDAANSHAIHIRFSDGATNSLRHFDGKVSATTFGAEQYVWHPDGANSHADPDGPPAVSSLNAKSDTSFTLPRASITVLRGKIQ
jgi:hypothetical protein